MLTILVGATSAACSRSADKTPAWTCSNVRIPMGATMECTSSTSEALTSDGTSENANHSGGTPAATDGPAYFCSADGDGSADCPPVDAQSIVVSATTDDSCPDDQDAGSGTGTGTGTGTGAGSGTGTGSVGTSDGTGSPDAATPPAGGDGAGKKGRKDSDAGTGSGTGTGTGTGTGSGGTGTSDGTSDGAGPAGGEFYCTKQAGKRTCRKAPTCDQGAHRVQMDCDNDVTVGFGDGAGAAAPPSSGGSDGVGYPGAGTSGADGTMPGGELQCFYPTTTTGAAPGMPAATAQYVLEALNGVQTLHVRLTFSPSFVDNSYGANAVGWAKGHTFAQLVGSDHAELTFLDKSAQEKLHFKMDYISQSASAPSGYKCLGVTGGEGRMILGDAASVVAASTSLDRDLNERGYKSFLVDSPATTASYAPSAATPKWDYRVVYEAWIKNDAFGASGFGSVQLAFVHASPSKLNTNTLPVTKGPCPAGWGVPASP
jgi:hypothetical protein